VENEETIQGFLSILYYFTESKREGGRERERERARERERERGRERKKKYILGKLLIFPKHFQTTLKFGHFGDFPPPQFPTGEVMTLCHDTPGIDDWFWWGSITQ